MDRLTAALAEHHGHCDNEFAAAEAAAARGDWPDCQRSFERFRRDLEAHFATEETALFPAFEQHTGMTGGPTQVMRLEHGQMRSLLEELDAATARHDADAFAGSAETLLILMQQHNMKEENILYPMCDRSLGADAALRATIVDGLRHGGSSP